MQLSGITALVTGARSGLGAATARALTGEGAAVVGLDLPPRPDAAPAPAEDGIRIVDADVTSESEVAAALATITTDDPPVRMLVNCAGIAPARKILSSRGSHELELFRATVEVNLVGSFNVLRLVAPLIAATEPDADGQRGVIVNTASVAAFDGQVGQAAYAASKAGIAGLTLPAARDLARYGIRVMTIAPGIVDTPLLAKLGPEVTASLAASVTFPARLAQPDEFAQLVVMIAQHDYLNGETIRMDGALRMSAE